MEKENKKVHVTEHTSCHNDEHFQAVESNLHAEQIHKSTKWRKRKTKFMLHLTCHNYEHYEAVESNLPTEQVHKCSKWRKRITKFMSLIIHQSRKNDKHYEAVKSNLHAEHKQVHKFTKVPSGEREKQSYHNSHIFSSQYSML